MDSNSDEISFDQIIYQSQPIHKIEELSYNTLNNHSQQFRLSLVNMEKQAEIQKPHTQLHKFHSFIVRLISMIQPSKIAISQILEEIGSFIDSYYPIQKCNQEEKELFTKARDSLQCLKRCLLLRQSQLGMVLYIQDMIKTHSKQEFIRLYRQNFEDITQYVIPVEKCFQPINYFILQKILQQQFVFYEEFSTNSTQLRQEISRCYKVLGGEKTLKVEERMKIDSTIKSLKVIASKITTIADLFPYACIKSQDDLFSKEKNDPRWLRLFNQNIISYKIYGEAQKVHQSFDNLKANLNIINAAMNIMDQASQNQKGLKGIKNLWQAFGKVIKVTLSKSEAYKQAQVMISDPNQKLAKSIWNLPERKQFKSFIQMSLPSISFSIHLFIPRMLNDYFQAKMNEKFSFFPDYTISNHAIYFKQMIEDSPQKKISIRINNYFALILREFQTQTIKEKSYLETKIEEMNKALKNKMENIRNKFVKKYPTPKSVIFHIHGGGFISMSSFIHQTYTRNWANNLEIPIVSVDYGKAPEHPYPYGLKDCLEAYLWTINSMHQLYEFQPQKIVLVGDSAGGNLVASLVNVLIEWGLRVPDGIVMVYPALNLNYFDYSPSLLTALNDMILPHTFLKICLNSYLKDDIYKPDSNYFVSPIVTPDHILKKYPPTHIFVGSKDPFHDDCCRFAQKLSLVKPQEVCLKVFEQFPHGFLQFDLKTQPHYYCRQATKEVQLALKHLLSQ